MNSILARFQDTAALLEVGQSAWFKVCTEKASEILENLEKESSASPAADGTFWYAADDWRAVYRPYTVINGILHIPVRGVLLNNYPYQMYGWATGYDYIREALRRGIDDKQVKGIVLNIESGGGMVSGNWDLVEFISECREVKPIRAVANDYAYSAAYNIAAATSHITVSRTGGLGSIGVIVTHFEYSRAMEANGVTVNFIRSKAEKAEGNPYEALSKEARLRIQSDVDELHDQFVNMVATNRSMSEAAIDGTNARTFMGQNALAAGLADTVDNFENAITAFEATFLTGDESMADFTKAEYEAAVAASRAEGHAAGVTEGHAAGVKEGSANAVARINAIIGSDEGKSRAKAALGAALTTSMPTEEAIAFLGTLDAEAAPAVNSNANQGAGAGALFAAAMGKEGGSEITATADAETSGENDEDAKSRAKVNGALGLAKGPKKAS